MANKVATIQGLLGDSQTELARQLMGLYSKWSNQRLVKENEWKELRNYIFATDTTTTSNQSLPWKNKTVIPKIPQIRDNLQANYMDALFPNDDWLIWDGDDNDSVFLEKRRIIEQYIKNKARLSGFREAISQLLYDYIDYGNCFAEVVYVNETHIDPVTQEEVTTYSGPKVFRISPYDLTFDPTAPSFNKSPKFTRYLKSIGELKNDIEAFPELQYDQKELEDLFTLRKNLGAFNKEDLNKAEGLSVDGFGSLSEYLGSGLIEIIEFEGDYYDSASETLYQNCIITIADRTKILRHIKNPNWLGVDNKVHVGWRERQDNLYAMGPLDNLVGLQYRLNHLENLKADAMDMTVWPPLKIVGDVDPFTWEPGVGIRVPEDGDVQPLPPNAAVFQVNTEIAYIMQLMEELAGAPKDAMGIRTPGEKTMFEVQSLQNSAGRIFNNKTNKFSVLFVEPLLNLMLESAKRNIDVADTIKVIDDDLGVAEFINITKDDITAKGKLRPVGARHYAAKAQLMQNLTTIFNSPLAAIIQPDLSRKALTRLIEETMGLSRYQLFQTNVAVSEQAETQGLVAEHANRLQNESTVPLEENMIPSDE